MDSEDYWLVLARPLRRELLLLLEDKESDLVELDQLATNLANSMDSREYEKIRLELHHHHLPKLQNLGVLTYDQHSNQIVYSQTPSELMDILLTVDDILSGQ